MNPKIIFEDQDILVIDKPSGVVVNRADTTRHIETVQDWAETYLKLPKVPEVSNASKVSKASDTSGTYDTSDTFLRRGGIVHRLDKETSGLLIIAKNEESFKNLQAQFKQGDVHKVYLALVHGKLTPEEGTIDLPIGRLPWNRMRFGILPQGRESITKYKVSEYKKLKINKKEEDFSLVQVYPETGRTHQIRVHMRHLGHPVFADPLYAGRKNMKIDRKFLPRLFLHAKAISFLHPRSGERMSFESDLPPDLLDFLEALGK